MNLATLPRRTRRRSLLHVAKAEVTHWCSLMLIDARIDRPSATGLMTRVHSLSLARSATKSLVVMLASLAIFVCRCPCFVLGRVESRVRVVFSTDRASHRSRINIRRAILRGGVRQVPRDPLECFSELCGGRKQQRNSAVLGRHSELWRFGCADDSRRAIGGCWRRGHSGTC